MRNRSLLDVAAAFENRMFGKTRMFQVWTSGWSAPTDEIFVVVRLPARHIDASGGVTDLSLKTAAQSAALKWHAEVCCARGGRVHHVTIDKVEKFRQPWMKQEWVRSSKALVVTARYCGRTDNVAFCFRHNVSDAHGNHFMRYVSQIHFDPQPDLPAYPTVQITGEAIAQCRDSTVDNGEGWLRSI